MDKYVTGAAIRRLREAKGLTQEELAACIHVSAKAVSKWETGRGFPDVSLLEPLAAALGISVPELLSGGVVQNRNRAGNMLRSKCCVCPVCGNVILCTGEALVSCCGITLPPLEAEEPDEEHAIRVDLVEDEYFVTVAHPMTKTHSLLFLAALSDQGIQLLRLYPEGEAAARFRISGVREVLACCNRHGLFRRLLPGRPAGAGPRAEKEREDSR